MQKNIMKIVSLILPLFIVLVYQVSYSAERSICGHDKECKKFEYLSDMQKDEKIIQMVDIHKKYSSGSRYYIGLAFLSVASKKADKSPGQAEYLYKEALLYGYDKAYIELYNLYAETDQIKAQGFLKEYAKKNPKDADLYFLLGDIEFKNNNYKLANKYLRKSKRYSSNHSASLDWLLFKVNYVLNNYEYASKRLGDALAQGNFKEEINALKNDPRFSGIEKKAEFKDYNKWFKN